MKKYLLSLILLLPLSTFVISQDADEEENVEEVVVTGIKASLIDALEIKRNKVGVTEIVTAETNRKVIKKTSNSKNRNTK